MVENNLTEIEHTGEEEINPNEMKLIFSSSSRYIVDCTFWERFVLLLYTSRHYALKISVYVLCGNSKKRVAIWLIVNAKPIKGILYQGSLFLLLSLGPLSRILYV